jgi:hypothetical protein
MAQGDIIRKQTVADNVRTSPVKPGSVGQALLAALNKKEA